MQWIGTTALASAMLFASFMFVLMYVVAPMIVRHKGAQAADREFLPTTAEDLSPTAREGLARAVHDLRSEGFEVVANVSRRNTLPGSTSVQALFVNRANGDMAEGFYVSVPSATGIKETWTLVLRTRFDDQFQITTASSSSPTMFPRDPNEDGINPHWIKSGRTLNAIHRERVERSSRAALGRILPAAGTEIEFLKADERRVFDFVIGEGFYWHDPAANVYRVTVKGAYVMTWRLLPPLKQWRRIARDRRTRRVLREMGFGWAAAD